MSEHPQTNGHIDDGQITRLTNGVPGSPPSDWIVQKFGGTSVGKFALEIVDKVIKPNIEDHRVAVVCSARSSSSKADGTTNRLLRAAREAENPKSSNYLSLIEAVKQEHIDVAREYVQNPDLKAELIAQVEAECLRILKILDAAQTLGETSSRCVDMVISAGEKLSCRFMTILLKDRGVDAQYVDLSDIIDFAAGIQALDQDFYDRLAELFGCKVQECTAKVPVVTGYFGVVPGGLLDKIGRGYTDLCAALVAVGVHAEELQVWKEVDGIFTADPRKVPTARLLSMITPAEAAELTFYGSEVIHPFTMEQVIRAKIPIRIKNVMKPKGRGTVIFPDSTSELEKTAPGHDPKLFRTRGPQFWSQQPGPKRPTAVTAKHKILVINVHSNKRSLSHGFFAGIFSVLDKWRLSIDLISTSEVHVSLALHSEIPLLNGVGHDEYQIIDEDLRGAIQDLRKYGTVDIIPEMAILSLVGKQMKNMVGVAGRMFTVLGEHNVNIEMISQGASEINISCVIEERDADRAINILHTNLFTFLD
ncbi:aspartate kinase [Coccidioides immitis RS]|uniref:Aspartokinase n=5 Tax=Coccidioides TaxID=5500 RepID=J3K805_COCIM|nr:aspartate kinase [Coccidioides immitis RS]XP_003069681.1 Aspartokinase, putative [Coccidioides posadasii C735 delta SOWgp]EFW22810.1 aspartokinase [Coccidioides posadasii str. Silveira]KMM67392.1 aspartokinase [Coccidioides posadasii RMSCC 3488]KMP03474.1 aspartokinase [Coccidioides immitis RMSCC 2394]TPX23765.1 Aspartokinase [Coccidioides immitis]EAS30887.3 aspartate kinase [Coccidioides immitis RS]|eukprot:XP_003069681.1 Aspartokinase, putative [Coccidioides posadasii C735 delta SOWgp]